MGFVEHQLRRYKRCSTWNSATLMRHYESFSMKEELFVDDMFGRLQVLINGLEALGHLHQSSNKPQDFRQLSQGVRTKNHSHSKG